MAQIKNRNCQKMIIKDSVTIDASDLHITKDGYLVAKGKIARAGNVQKYMGSELGLTGDDAEKIFGVYRDPDMVFDKESMQSLAGRPVTRGHPGVEVNADNWRDLAKGQVGGTIAKEGEHVVASMAIMDAEAVKEIQKGAKGLSAGYTCGLVKDEGVSPDGGVPYQYRQTGPLRFNHVAYLPDNNPRAGNTTIGDSTTMTLKTIVLGDQAVQVDPASEVHIVAYKAMHAKTLADHATAIEGKDKEIGELKAKLKMAEDRANIDIDALVAARSEFVEQVKAIDSSVDCTGKSDIQIMRSVVSAKLGDETVKGASDDVVRGMFAVVSSNSKVDPVRKVIGSGLKQVGDAATQERDAWEKSVSDLNSWRNK